VATTLTSDAVSSDGAEGAGSEVQLLITDIALIKTQAKVNVLAADMNHSVDIDSVCKYAIVVVFLVVAGCLRQVKKGRNLCRDSGLRL